MGFVVKALGSYSNGSPVGFHRQKRGVHVLTDGTLVSVVYDMNTTNAARNGNGDGTGIGKIYVYTSPGGGTWALRATVSTTLNADSNPIMGVSSAIDSANNLHLTWTAVTTPIFYTMLTYATGPSYTAGSTVTLFTPATGTASPVVDIDSFGTTPGNAVVGYYLNTTSNTTQIQVITVLNGGASFHRTILNTISEGVIVNSDVSVAALHTNTSPNVVVAVGYARITSANGDSGDETTVASINTSTFVINQFNVLTWTAPKGAGRYRRVMVFTCEDDPGRFVFVGACPTAMWYTAKFDASSMPATKLSNLYVDTTDHPFAATPLNTATPHRISFAYRLGRVAFFSVSTQDPYLVNVAKFNSDASVDFISYGQTYLWDTSPASSSISALGAIVAGGNRNLNSSNTTGLGPSALLYYCADPTFLTTKRVEYRGYAIPTAPAVTVPSANQTFATGFPTVEARYELPYDKPQSGVRLTWQVAADAGFVAITNTITQGQTSFTRVDDTSLPATDVRGSWTPVSPNYITSGTKFIQAAEIDFFGNTGPWSASISFKVRHVPSAANLFPTNDVVVAYSTGNLHFNWDFTDPFSSDFQTGYQIVIENATSGATVIDTGQVSSQNSKAVVAIPASAMDIQLRWKISLSDMDGVWGPFSAYNTFYTSNPPTPVILNPPDGDQLSSGSPMVKWDPGLGGTKTEQFWRVVISSGDDIIWTKQGADTSTQVRVPSGLLHNNTNYTFTFAVTDSLGLSAIVSNSVSTAWTPPAGVSTIRTYQYDYDRRGFVFIGWDSSSLDTDFVQWNVYRQAIDEDTPFLHTVVTGIDDTYGIRDHTARSGIRYSYWVTQVVNRFGDLVESTANTVLFVTPTSSNYWLTDPATYRTAPLFLVKGDSFTDEHEESVMNIIGRGRHVDVGDRLGYSGSLDIQLRDRQIGALLNAYNWLPNPGLEDSDDADTNPDKWTLNGFGVLAGTKTLSYQTFYEPTVSGRYQSLVVNFDHWATTSSDYFELMNDPISLDGTDLLNYDFIYPAIFMALSPLDPASGWNVRIRADWINTDGLTVLSNSSVASTIVETYEPQFSGDANSGNWQRYGASIAVPNGLSGANFLRIRYRFFLQTASVNPQVYLDGVSLNSGVGQAVLPYFDGGMRGAQWVNVANGASYSDGMFSAREQRAAIESMRELSKPLFLRNPFGDQLYVSIGDEATSREAGMGITDAGDYTIPYRVVAF